VGLTYTALEVAIEKNHPEIFSLLERFTADPVQTHYQMLEKLGVLGERAAEVFALIVFLCDDFLQLEETGDQKQAAIRFIEIARRLPMEVQMIVCRRLVDSVKDSILAKDSEVAFKDLARILLSPPEEDQLSKMSNLVVGFLSSSSLPVLCLSFLFVFIFLDINSKAKTKKQTENQKSLDIENKTGTT